MVAFLRIVDVEGPVHMRQPVIHMPNVRGQGTAHLVRCTLDPLVGPNFLHFMAVFRAVGAENRKIGLKIAFSGS